MKKFPKIKYPNHEEAEGLLDGDVVVLEKYDGANFRFEVTESGIRLGTRNTEFPLGDENTPHAFRHAEEWIRSLDDHVIDILRGVGTLYGEAMHLHSLDYEDIEWETPQRGSPHVPLDSETPNVVLFDWWNGDDWANWRSFEAMTETCGLPTARVIERGAPEDCSFEVPEESEFGGAPEGIVVRRIDGSVRAKKVTDDFKEKNAVAFNDPSKAEGDAAEFVAMYVTPQRIEKEAHKLVDEGEYESLQMPMMEDLPRRVLTDVMAEHGWELLTNDFEAEWNGDFKSDVRSRTSKKCVRVLKQQLQSI